MFVKNKSKSILSLAISLAIIMLSLAVPINTQFSASATTYPTPPAGITVWSGNTQEVTAENNTYNVSTAEQLAWALKSNLKIKKINLTADIYLNDLTNFDSWNSTTEGLHNWTSAELPDPTTFCRVEIQGNNHTIYGLYDVNTTGNAGLIHNFTTDWPNYFKCYNLGIDYAYISGKNSGAFVALYTLQGDQRANDIVFENCFVGENVIIDCPADSNGAGGFVGAGSGLWSYQEYKSISYKNCYSLVNIKNSGNVKDGKYGAFVGKGYLKNISMEYCYTNNDKMFGSTTPYWDNGQWGKVDPTINYSPVALKQGSSYYTTACAVENMKGITAAISMANLGAAYVTTDGYPILAVFNNDPNAVPLGTLGTTYFAGGKGTEAEPLLISTEEHLKNALDLFGANLHYKLTNDIYVEADKWYAAPSHDGYTNSKGVLGAFSGTLDGDGYAVKGISYPLIGQWTNEKYTFATGLIPVIDNATVKNITISNSYFTASSLLDSSHDLKTQAYISPVCGIVKASAEFSNVTVDETVIVEYSAKGAYDCWAVMGGIVGNSNSNRNNNQLTKITNCGVSCRVKGNYEKENNKGVRLVGLVGEWGWWCNLDISNSYSKGLPTLDYSGGDDGNFKLSNLFSDTDYSPGTDLKFIKKGQPEQIKLDSLVSNNLIDNANFDAANWYAVEGKTPMLRIRGVAIADVDENGVGLEDGDFAALRKHLLDVETKQNSDVNRNGEVNILDLVVLKQRMSGTYPVVKDKKIALTFDDGPNDLVPSICDVVAKYSGKATFFVVGNNVSANKKSLQYAVDKGFEIGNHSMTHATYTDITLDEVKKQISDCDAAVKAATGYEMKLIRYPGFATNDEIDEMVKKDYGRPTINGYGIGESDTATVADLQNGILNAAKDGRVILMHCQSKTLAALDRALNELTQRGYEFVTVSELFGGTENIPLGSQQKDAK